MERLCKAPVQELREISISTFLKVVFGNPTPLMGWESSCKIFFKELNEISRYAGKSHVCESFHEGFDRFTKNVLIGIQ